MNDRGRSSARELHIAEPPIAYRVLPPLTVDCSVLAAALFREADFERQAHEVMRQCRLHAPDLIRYEIANVAVKKAASIGEFAVRTALDGFETLDLTLHRVDLKASFELARQYEISSYDSAYLWLAGELKAPLATFDRKLAEAARRYLGSFPG